MEDSPRNSRPLYSQRSGRSATKSLGLESNVSSIFNQTRDTISVLNNDIEYLKKTLEDLTQRTQDLTTQKTSLYSRNKKLEEEISSRKKQNDSLLDQRNQAKHYHTVLKKELETIGADWEAKKKALQHEINKLNEASIQALEEKTREQQAFEQQRNALKKKNDSILKNIDDTNMEIRKYKEMIANLKNQEYATMEAIAAETNKFREFLEIQKTLESE